MVNKNRLKPCFISPHLTASNFILMARISRYLQVTKYMSNIFLIVSLFHRILYEILNPSCNSPYLPVPKSMSQKCCLLHRYLTEFYKKFWTPLAAPHICKPPQYLQNMLLIVSWFHRILCEILNPSFNWIFQFIFLNSLALSDHFMALGDSNKTF